MLDRCNVIAGVEEARGGPGVEPGHAAAQQLYVQLFLLEIEQIQIGDLELAARRWAQGSAKIDNALVVNIQPRHRKMTFRVLRFFLETDCFAHGVEFHHAVTLRVAHLISKNASSALDGESLPVEIESPIKDVIAQDQRCAGAAGELCGNQKSLRDSLRLRLLGVLNPNPKLRAVV